MAILLQDPLFAPLSGVRSIVPAIVPVYGAVPLRPVPPGQSKAAEVRYSTSTMTTSSTKLSSPPG